MMLPRKIWRWLLLACAAALTAQAPVCDIPTPSAGPGAITFSTTYGGVVRTAVVHLPNATPPGSPVPLMISLHSTNSTGAGQERITGFDAVADTNNFIVVYPDSVGASWDNSGTSNDVDWIANTLIPALEAAYPIDAARIYTSGYSDGGGIAEYIWMCNQTLIAGIANVSENNKSGTMGFCGTLSHTVRWLKFHGTGDGVVPYNGGTNPQGATVLSAIETTRQWAAQNACANSGPGQYPTLVAQSGYSTQTYTGCANGQPVVLYTTSYGHTWPGGTQSGASPVPIASQVIWAAMTAP